MRIAHTANNASTNDIRNLNAIFKLIHFLFQLLFDIVNKLKESVPTDTLEARMVWAMAPPDKDRLTNDMVLRHKSPITGVG